MKIQINSQHPEIIKAVKKVLNFYQGRLGKQISVMKIDIAYDSDRKEHQPDVILLQAQLIGGELIRIKENVSDITITSKRLFNRLDRELERHNRLPKSVLSSLNS